MLYLDHAATTAMRPAVFDAVAPLLRGGVGNPSSHHTVGEQAARVLADARARVAAVCGVRASDVIFVSGGTEANNLAVAGITLGSGERPRLVTTRIEHESVLRTAEHLAARRGVDLAYADVDPAGRIILDGLRATLGTHTTLLSTAYANNEIGTVQDVAAVVDIAHDAGALVHLDAVQAAGWLPLRALGVDALSIAGHKIGAGSGTGALIVRSRIPIEPILHGGGQERGARSGTESVVGALALATALELAEAERATTAARTAEVRDAFIDQVLRDVPRARLTGDSVHRSPGHASFTFAGTSGEAVLLELERRGIVSSSGSACAAGSDEASHVLTAIGIAESLAQTSVRFTLPHGWTAPLDTVAVAVRDAVAAVSGDRLAR